MNNYIDIDMIALNKLFGITISDRGYGRAVHMINEKHKNMDKELHDAIKQGYVKCKLTYAVGVGTGVC